MTVSEPLPTEKDNGRKRWLILLVCVTAPKRISDTLAMRAASGVCTLKFCPYDNFEGAEVITGRALLNK